MEARLHCMDCSMGPRKTPSENMAPIPTQMMVADAARTTQP